LAVVLRAVDFLAAVFLAVVLRAVDFFAADFFAVFFAVLADAVLRVELVAATVTFGVVVSSSLVGTRASWLVRRSLWSTSSREKIALRSDCYQYFVAELFPRDVELHAVRRQLCLTCMTSSLRRQMCRRSRQRRYGRRNPLRINVFRDVVM
jgi:hypothetical protein